MIGKQFLYSITEYRLNQESNCYEEHHRTSRSCRLPSTLEYYSYQLAYLHQKHTFHMGIHHFYPAFQMHASDDDALRVYFVLEGVGLFNGNDVHSGQCFYAKPYQNYSIHVSENLPMSAVWFTVRGSMSEKLTQLLDQSSIGQVISYSYPEQVQQLTDFFLQDFSFIHNPPLFIDGIIQQFASFIHLDEDARFDPDKFSTHIKDLVSLAVTMIEKELPTVSVSSISTALHLERKYFSRIFFEVMGMTPQDYIIETKMKLAEHYLSKTDDPIEKIMSKLGYNHRNGLSSAFKKHYGYSPTAYRAKLKSEKKKKV